MGPTKEVVIDKLFGGPKHGLRVHVDERLPTVMTYSTPKNMFFDYGKDAYYFENSVYTRRYGGCGQTKVIFYAHSSASDHRAFEMLCNYMLRGARKIS